MSIEIKDLVTNPETAPFSRLKYLARSSEEEVTKFFNGLFNLATLAREANDWTAVDGYLEQWEETLASSCSSAPASPSGEAESRWTDPSPVDSSAVNSQSQRRLQAWSLAVGLIKNLTGFSLFGLTEKL